MQEGGDPGRELNTPLAFLPFARLLRPVEAAGLLERCLHATKFRFFFPVDDELDATSLIGAFMLVSSLRSLESYQARPLLSPCGHSRLRSPR